MPYLWARDNPDFKLTTGSLFDVTYPQDLASRIKELRGVQMSETEVNEIASNIFEHPSLDLKSTFYDFRLSESPHLEDINSIQNFLEECQKDVTSLDAKIKDTISTISQLSRELTEASARMVQKVSQTRLCEFLLSSHKLLPKYLPQDIIEEIFLACLASHDSPVPNSNHPPLQLAAVCHRWRTIALSMPTLWNTFYISIPNHLELARAWLGRCDRPDIIICSEDYRVSSSKIQDFVNTLDSLSISPRIVDVRYLDGHLGDVIRKFMLEHNQLALEELVIRGQQGALPSFPETTSLRRIYSQFLPPTLRHTPPSSELTVLWLTPVIHHTTLVTILVNCPNLESLYIALSPRGLQVDNEPTISGDITLSRLRYLGIWERSKRREPGAPDDLLKRFSFPALRIIEYCEGKKSAPWLGFAHALRHVQRLTFQSREKKLSLDFFVSLVQHAPSLLELAISTNAQSMPDVIKALTSIVLPTLQTLYLDISYSSLIMWQSLEPQLKEFGQAWSSKEGAASLQQLVIQFWYTKEGDSGEAADDTEEEDEDDNQNDEDEPDTIIGDIEPSERVDTKQTIQSACPELEVRVVGRVSEDYWFWDVPILFGMTPLPSNAALPHDVLQEDGSWRRTSSHLYRIM